MKKLGKEVSKQLGWLIFGVKKKKKSKDGPRYNVRIKYDFSHKHFYGKQ